MESGQNATPSMAQRTKTALGSPRANDKFYSIQSMVKCVLFDPSGHYLTLTFDDHSTLRIERQSASTHGLTARVVQELEPGRMPAPWEEV